MAIHEQVKDLDILRPPPNCKILGGEEVDLSYVPTGITFEVDELLEKINSIASTREELLSNSSKLKEMFELSIDLCVLFCSVKHPKLNKEWFYKETVPAQVKAIVDEIRVALQHSYDGVIKYGKNG